jgi:hypothetical protein
MEVCAGHEQSLGGDPQQGVLQIRVWEPDQTTLVSIGAYETPERVGVMHIVVADNNSVTIASEDGQTIFTFDIATRQWVPNPPLPTPLDTPSATATLNAKEQVLAHEEETMVAIRTSVALTGVPTWTPGAPPPYTGPTDTPRLGLQRGCANRNSLDPYMVSCWVGIYNGKIVEVRTGREGRAGDMTQGLVWILGGDTWGSQFIKTPDKVGAIQIVAVNGTLFTLTTVDHTPVITYTFDLATHGWIPNPPLPSPSVSP